MKKYFLIPKVQLTLALLAIYLSVLITHFSLSILYLFIESLVFCIGIDLLLFWFRNKKAFIPYAGIVSGLIISLTLAPNTPILGVLLVSAIAIVIKQFIRISNKHIFNPAATGLVIGGILLKEQVSWWGVSYQTINDGKLLSIILFLILLLPLLVSAYRMRRYLSIITFYIFYAISSFFLLAGNSFSNWIPVILSPSLIFFSIVMVPEPMTSPVNFKRQFFYGLAIGILTLILLNPIISNFLTPQNLLPDPYLIALLIANAIFFNFK